MNGEEITAPGDGDTISGSDDYRPQPATGADQQSSLDIASNLNRNNLNENYLRQVRESISECTEHINVQIEQLVACLSENLVRYVKPSYIRRTQSKILGFSGVAKNCRQLLDDLSADKTYSPDYFNGSNGGGPQTREDNEPAGNLKLFYETVDNTARQILSGDGFKIEQDGNDRYKLVYSGTDEQKRGVASTFSTELADLYDAKEQLSELGAKLEESERYKGLYEDAVTELEHLKEENNASTEDFNNIRLALENAEKQNLSLEEILKTRHEVKKLFEGMIEVSGIRYILFKEPEPDSGSDPIHKNAKEGVRNLDYKKIFESYKKAMEAGFEERVAARTEELSKKAEELSTRLSSTEQEKAEIIEKLTEYASRLESADISYNKLDGRYKVLDRISGEKAVMLESISEVVALLVEQNNIRLKKIEYARKAIQEDEMLLSEKSSKIADLEFIISKRNKKLEEAESRISSLMENIDEAEKSLSDANIRAGEAEAEASRIKADYKDYAKQTEAQLLEAKRTSEEHNSIIKERETYKARAEKAEAMLDVFREEKKRRAELDEATINETKRSLTRLNSIYDLIRAGSVRTG